MTSNLACIKRAVNPNDEDFERIVRSVCSFGLRRVNDDVVVFCSVSINGAEKGACDVLILKKNGKIKKVSGLPDWVPFNLNANGAIQSI